MKIRIGLYEWEVRLATREETQGNDGQTKCNEFLILIADDLKPETREIILRHEVVHAILDTQGRVFQNKFNLEELCEFIAWKLPEINIVMSSLKECFIK